MREGMTRRTFMKWAVRCGGYSDPAPVSDVLSEGGVIVLRNANATRTFNGQPLTIIGLDDLRSGSMNPDLGFRGLPLQQKAARIVLAHNPDMKCNMGNREWDLMLCGHTHGGQVCLPGFGAPVLPVKDRRFIHGLYPWAGRQLQISSGVGSFCGVRFNCPPEICHLELKGIA